LFTFGSISVSHCFGDFPLSLPRSRSATVIDVNPCGEAKNPRWRNTNQYHVSGVGALCHISFHSVKALR
jgi:hypothetical protein